MEFIKVKNFASVITGGTPSTKKKEYWNGGNIPWLNSGELNQDIVKTTRNYITELGLQKSAAKLMPKDTVLIALTGATTGVVGYLTFESTANQSVTGILPSDKHIPKYLFYYLKSIRPKVLHDAYGGAQPHISQGYVKELKIPLPPLDQQKQIAKILDTADAYRQKTKALIDKYDQLTQSLFLEMFGDPVRNPKGWEKTSLESCLKKVHKIGKDFSKDSIEYVDIASVDNIRNIITETTTYAIKERPSRAQQILHSDDVIFSTVRPNLKNIAINHIDGRIGSTGFFVCRTDRQKLSNLFLFKVLLSDSATDYFVGITSGANYPAVKSTDMRKFQIIIPPLELQNQFAKRVQAIEAQKAIAQKELDKAEELFRSLLQRAFKGDLL